MKSWISILSLLLFASNASAVCRFKEEITKVYSLSGPMTVALKETGLLKDPKLKGISIFNPVLKDEFRGVIMPGGIFLSKEATNELQGSLVFFDESRELSRIFSQSAVHFISRGLSPTEVVEKSIEILRKHTLDCEKEFKSFSGQVRELTRKILGLMNRAPRAVVFLGEIRNGRPPETVIANDGIVKWLKDQNSLSTYPSKLGYVSWSMKILEGMPKDTIRVGMIDTARSGEMKVSRLSKRDFNLRAPGSLVPGLTQLKAWHYFLESLHE